VTDDEVADLIEAGWVPPPSFWLPPAEAQEGEVVLVWLVGVGEPFATGTAEFAYRENGAWLDIEDREVEHGDAKVAAIGPAPTGGVEMSIPAERLLRKYRALERAGELPPPAGRE
jgi:hypothetical protein